LAKSEPHKFGQASLFHVVVKKQNFSDDLKLLFEPLLVVLEVKLLQHSFLAVVLNRSAAEYNRLLTKSVFLADNKREKQIDIWCQLHLVFGLVVEIGIFPLIAVFKLLEERKRDLFLI